MVFALAVPGHDDVDLTAAVRRFLRDTERTSGLPSEV
jgi:hypothetical protein